MEYTIRRVELGDEEALAYVQTESWKAGFKDILSARILAQHTCVEDVAQRYRRLLEQKIGNGYLLTVEGAPHCIAWWNAARESDMPGYAELICIHSLPHRWRRGYGRAMMEVVLRDVAQAGYSKIMLWVFEKNTGARRFYEALGFAANGKQKNDRDALELCYEKSL